MPIELPHPWLHIDGRPIDPDRWKATLKVAQYDRKLVLEVQHDLNNGVEPVWDDFQRHGITPSRWTDEIPNQMVQVGLNLLGNLLIGAGGNAFTHAGAIFGVGSGTTAWNLADTHLGGDGSSSTAWYQGADSGYPSQSNGVITCNATVASGNANFSGGWQEWCFATASGTISTGSTLSGIGTGVIMLNHKIANLGTKVSGSVWVGQGVISEQ